MCQKGAPPYPPGWPPEREEIRSREGRLSKWGAGTTGIGVFYEGQLVFAARIPVGGNHVTNDLTVRFKKSFTNAERLKTLKGSAYASQTYVDEEIDIPLLGEDERVSSCRVPRMELVEVIIPRVQETFRLVRHQLETNGFYDLCLNFVLTAAQPDSGGPGTAASVLCGKTPEGRSARPPL